MLLDAQHAIFSAALAMSSNATSTSPHLCAVYPVPCRYVCHSLFVCFIFMVTPMLHAQVPAYGGPRTNTAYGVQNVTSWGGNILYDSQDGMYHLFVSRMGGGKGLSSWGDNSQIDHAVAADPMDQFKYTDTALAREVSLTCTSPRCTCFAQIRSFAHSG